jgi:hypothetical protein
MSGQNWEYVMGNRTTSDTQTTSNASYFTNPLTLDALNYTDLYKTTSPSLFGIKPTWSTSSTEQYYNNDVCTWNTCGGHALHETKVPQSVSSSSQSWGGDYSNFVNSDYPWFRRGGDSNLGSYAGLFASYDGSGSGNNSIGFRVVLLVGF